MRNSDVACVYPKTAFTLINETEWSINDQNSKNRNISI